MSTLGTFLIIIIGMTIATLAFGMEHYVHKHRSSERFGDAMERTAERMVQLFHYVTDITRVLAQRVRR